MHIWILFVMHLCSAHCSVVFSSVIPRYAESMSSSVITSLLRFTFFIQVLSGVALLSFKASRVPKDKEHPYGHFWFVPTLFSCDMIINLLLYDSMLPDCVFKITARKLCGTMIFLIVSIWDYIGSRFNIRYLLLKRRFLD